MLARLLFFAVLLATSPVWALHKCVMDGKTVYQQFPCPDSGELVGDEIARREQERRVLLAQEQRRREQEEARRLTKAAEPERPAYASTTTETEERHTGQTYYGNSRAVYGSNQAVHTGPRGGQYTVSPSGRRSYVSRGRR